VTLGAPLTRDRFATRAAILDSAATILSTLGAPALRVNALAHAAKCDKVLIYRYFGGLDGVLKALGAERRLWPRAEVGEDSDGSSLADAVRTTLLEEWAAITDQALIRAAVAAESSGNGALAPPVAEQRAESHARMISQLRASHRIPHYTDLPALVELISAALAMLALRAAPATQSSDSATPDGRRRIEKMVGAITRALLEPNGG
jgi:AcrR family transcriptional regulator